VDDDVSTPRSARFVAENIGSKTVESILLHDSYHMLTIDNEREQVATDTIRFFNAAHSTGTAGWNLSCNLLSCD
jgi:carboxylesterase